ncbi:MAG: type II secretion system protein J [Candidatus Dormibacteria bacterium]
MEGRWKGWGPRGRLSAPTRGRRAGERGLTLIELLVTIAVMSVAVVGITAGLAATQLDSSIAQTQAQLEAAMRDVSDYVGSDQLTYVGCAAPSNYQGAVSELSLPTGVTATVINVWKSTKLNGVLLTGSACPGGGYDLGVQEIRLQVATATHSLTREVWKGEG